MGIIGRRNLIPTPERVSPPGKSVAIARQVKDQSDLPGIQRAQESEVVGDLQLPSPIEAHLVLSVCLVIRSIHRYLDGLVGLADYNGSGRPAAAGLCGWKAMGRRKLEVVWVTRMTDLVRIKGAKAKFCPHADSLPRDQINTAGSERSRKRVSPATQGATQGIEIGMLRVPFKRRSYRQARFPGENPSGGNRWQGDVGDGGGLAVIQSSRRRQERERQSLAGNVLGRVVSHLNLSNQNGVLHQQSQCRQPPAGYGSSPVYIIKSDPRRHVPLMSFFVLNKHRQPRERFSIFLRRV